MIKLKHFAGYSHCKSSNGVSEVKEYYLRSGASVVGAGTS